MRGKRRKGNLEKEKREMGKEHFLCLAASNFTGM
jgi:hypothetical protein